MINQAKAAPPRAVVSWIAIHEPWLALLALPPLLLPEFLAPLLPLGGAILLVLAACRVLARRPLRLGGLADPALLTLLIMLPISLAVSSDLERSVPKFTTTVIGIFLFWSLALAAQNRRDLRAAAILLSLSGFGLAGLALLGTDWPRSKVLHLWGLYDRLPKLVLDLPRSTRGAFDPNEVAGALVLLLPVALAVVLGVWAQWRAGMALSLADVTSLPLPPVLRRPAVLLCLLIAVLAMLVPLFVLTQSRGALAAMSGGLVVLFGLRWPRPLLAAAALAGLLGAAALLGGQGLPEMLAERAPGSVEQGPLATALAGLDALTRLGGGSSETASGRIEMWRNAVWAIADYPFTGSGFHTFPAVSWANYVYTVVSPRFNMTHAHNAYLQAGVDFGVAGLAAFLALAGTLLFWGWQALRRSPPPFERWLLCGLLGALAGHLVHSLVDVAGRPLGDKPGIIFWIAAGLLAAEYRSGVAPVIHAPIPARKQMAAVALTVAAAALAGWATAVGPLRPAVALNMGGLALDQARLRPGMTEAQRRDLLETAIGRLQQALPYRADVVYLRLGLAAEALGRSDEAYTYWRQTPLALPHLLSQADARLSLGQEAEAVAYTVRALAVAPASSSALYHSGVMAMRRGRAADARSAFERALAADDFLYPVNERAAVLKGLGDLYAAERRWADAVEMYRQAQTVSPGIPVHTAVAWALYRRDGNSVAAEAYLRESIAAGPPDVHRHEALMQILQAAGDADQALAVGLQAIPLFPEHTEALLATARLYSERKQYPDAEMLLRRALAIRPRQTETFVLLGQVELAQGRAQEAAAALRQAVALAPAESSYHVLLGDALRRAGDSAGAAAAYRQALSLDPKNTAAQRGLESLR